MGGLEEGRVFLSALHNPYQNLALEHGLFQSLPAPSLFLYTNAPCVVIGRAQNPWVEANLPFMQMQHIPLVRRQSGGGTVVHDLGNLNFSFISPKAQHNKTQNLQIILHALQRLGIPAEMNERHDLILQGKKISGSAFRETRNNCFHHGTLLIDADLPMLREALAAPPRSIRTNAVKSVRSSVMNLRDFNSVLSLQQIQAEIIQSFLQYHKIQLTSVILGLAALDHPLIQAEYNLYQSHEWLYHKTLPFEEHIDINGQAVKITVENGVITHCQPLLPQCSAWIKRDFSLWSLK